MRYGRTAERLGPPRLVAFDLSHGERVHLAPHSSLAVLDSRSLAFGGPEYLASLLLGTGRERKDRLEVFECKAVAVQHLLLQVKARHALTSSGTARPPFREDAATRILNGGLDKWTPAGRAGWTSRRTASACWAMRGLFVIFPFRHSRERQSLAANLFDTWYSVKNIVPLQIAATKSATRRVSAHERKGGGSKAERARIVRFKVCFGVQGRWWDRPQE